MTDRPVPVAITIAGSDSGGGAGIQADLKAFARCGVHGASAIVALTAQNTVEVISVHPVPRQMILDQVRAVAEDIGVDAVKVGMLGDEATIAAVVEALRELGELPVVVDPVMVAESGAVLLEPDAKRALIERVLPRATVVTPNLAEARELTGLGEEATQEELARAVRGLGPAAVVVTGGHTDERIDVLVEDQDEPWKIAGPVSSSGASHGSGCTHSSALAALLAQGASVREAAFAARAIAADAVEHGLGGLGKGSGPVDVLGIVAPD